MDDPYKMPKMFFDILEFDVNQVYGSDTVICNYNTPNIACMLNEYFVHFTSRVEKSVDDRHLCLKFSIELLLVFNFFLQKQLLYKNEKKRNLLTKRRSDFDKMEKSYIEEQFTLFKQMNMDIDLFWCSFTFAPRYLLRLFNDLPYYYGSMNKYTHINPRIDAFLAMRAHFFDFILDRIDIYFPECIEYIKAVS